jgi:hypothetical protein
MEGYDTYPSPVGHALFILHSRSLAFQVTTRADKQECPGGSYLFLRPFSNSDRIIIYPRIPDLCPAFFFFFIFDVLLGTPYDTLGSHDNTADFVDSNE